jgi:hypothetical protein
MLSEVPMPRVSLETAHRARTDVHRLRAEGLSIRQIAASLCLSVGSVNNYLKMSPGVSPGEYLDACIALKKAEPYLGPMPILDRVTAQFGLSFPLVAHSTLSDHFRKADLAVALAHTKGDHKRPFWFDEININRACVVWQLDTVKLVLSVGEVIELLVVTDMFSRATWAVHLPKNGSEAHCLAQCFEVLGVPDVISADNGRGWPMDNSKTLSDLICCAFKHGVKRFQFVPISSPGHNGRVERQNRTLKYREWYHAARYNCQTADDVVSWVYGGVRQYNECYSHRAVGGRGKHNRLTPMQAHLQEFNAGRATRAIYNPRRNVAHQQLSYSVIERQITPGIVSYIRRLTNSGNAFVGAPELVFSLSHTVGSWYARFDLHHGGKGDVLLFDPARPKGGIVGHFSHPWGTPSPLTYLIKCQITAKGFVPRLADDELETLREQRHQKRKASRPKGYRAGGFREVPHPHDPDGWQLVNRYGRVVHSSDNAYLPDHSDDLGL